MYIRNENPKADPKYIEVQTEQDIDALNVSSYSKWLFKCALITLTSTAQEPNDDMTRQNIRQGLQSQLEENPHLIEVMVICDERNNPPTTIATQTIATVHMLFDGGFGELIYSFSTKEM